MITIEVTLSIVLPHSPSLLNTLITSLDDIRIKISIVIAIYTFFFITVNTILNSYCFDLNMLQSLLELRLRVIISYIIIGVCIFSWLLRSRLSFIIIVLESSSF